MYIKIINCTRDDYWYKDMIGTVFEVKFYDEPSRSYVVDNIDGTGNTMGSIFKGDYEIVDDYEDHELFIPPEPPKTEEEIRYESLQNELELTQNALNEMLMNMMSMKGGE